MGVSVSATSACGNQQALSRFGEIMKEFAGPFLEDCSSQRYADLQILAVLAVLVAAFPVPPAVRAILDPTDTFVRRHLGSIEAELREMLGTLGLESFEESRPLCELPPGLGQLVAGGRAPSVRGAAPRSLPDSARYSTRRS